MNVNLTITAPTHRSSKTHQQQQQQHPAAAPGSGKAPHHTMVKPGSAAVAAAAAAAGGDVVEFGWEEERSDKPLTGRRKKAAQEQKKKNRSGTFGECWAGSSRLDPVLGWVHECSVLQVQTCRCSVLAQTQEQHGCVCLGVAWSVPWGLVQRQTCGVAAALFM